MEEAEPSNSSTIEEDINFITSSSNPNKRRHVSSISKAMLAKKILNKIETENDPFHTVTPKVLNNEESSGKTEESTHHDNEA